MAARVFSIESCVKMLHQKNRAAREEGLKDLVAALEGFVRADEIDDQRYEQALDRCFSFLNSNNGGSSAYRAIGLYALNAGSSKADRVLGVDRLLHTDRVSVMVPSSPSDAGRAVAAINCLAAATLACAKRPADAKPSLKAIWEVVIQQHTAIHQPQVLAAALSAWTVVLPAVRDIGTTMTPFVLIAKLLRADDPAVRMAAGEALAVCVELNILPHQPDPPTYWEQHYGRLPEPEPEDRPSLESRVFELAFPKGDTHKKARAEEVSLFRQINDFLKNNRRPAESWSSGGVELKVCKWAKLVQLNFLSQYIGEAGFYAHFDLNLPLFRDSFGLTGAASAGAEDKRHCRHDGDKQRSKDLRSSTNPSFGSRQAVKKG